MDVGFQLNFGLGWKVRGLVSGSLLFDFFLAGGGGGGLLFYIFLGSGW